MRNTVRLALAAAAVAALAVPAAPASAIACRDPFGPVCATLCKVMTTLDRPCLR